MAELIYSIEEVFSISGKSFLKENQYYNIPEYQRGYKWSADNVKTLLDDILKFQNQNILNGKVNDKFYCVQNITLCSHTKDGKQYYNVVDGQQRLTTLLIILSYLEEDGIIKEKLKYSIRDESDEFIKEYIIGRRISSFKNWKELEKSLDVKFKRKDVFYISEAAFAVKEWFENDKIEKQPEDKHEALSKETILNHVKLIVNNLTGTNEEKIFSNLNGAKVNLDGADLVRGILMTRVAGEILGNDQNKERTNEHRVRIGMELDSILNGAKVSLNGADLIRGILMTRVAGEILCNDQNKERINEHRVRIGMELDAINLWWGNKEVAKYFRQLLPDKTSKTKSFDLLSFPINTLYMLYFETFATKNNEFSFKFFEYGIDGNNKENDNHLEMYQGILKLHYEMQDWFENREIYHLVGYLFNYFKGTEITFNFIYKKWIKATSKNDFIEELKSEIFQQLIKNSSGKDDRDESTKFEDLKASINKEDENWYEKSNLFRTLVLMDIIQITKSNNLGFLPVDFFKPKEEDKEHIRPQTPKKDKEESKLKDDWENFIVDLPELVQKEVKEILEKSQTEELIENDLIAIRNIINRIGLNSIGNMALLNLSVNRGYGNAAYIDKRREILNHYIEGKYIRPHTLNAFVKKDCQTEDLNKWELVDIKKNAERISKEIDKYFNGIISK